MTRFLGAFYQSNSATEVIELVTNAIAAGFETAPALTIGLVAVAALPLLVVGGAVARRFSRPPVPGEKTWRQGTKTQLVGARGSEGGKIGVGSSPESMPAPAYSRAIVSIEADGEGAGANGTASSAEGTSGEVFQFGTGMFARIGREADNDICLTHPTVHRYHALIRRSYEEGYEISDLSDAAGNGVLLNGKRISNATLSDGDVIGLGAARLKFGLPQ